MIENLAWTRKQVSALIAVDNGSGQTIVSQLQAAAGAGDFSVLSLPENVGIAAALNTGVTWAKSQGFEWVILFDQDSKPSEGCLENLFTAWSAHKERERVSAIHPNLVDENGNSYRQEWASDGGLLVAMTSGALMPLWVFDKLGPFLSDYFIDIVDTEYCLRMRRKGYMLICARNAELLHHLGNPREIRFLFRTFTPSYYSPMRRYYMTRNRLDLLKRYKGDFPDFMRKLRRHMVKDTVKCLLLESNRIANLRAVILGIRDGISGHLGKRHNV